MGAPKGNCNNPKGRGNAKGKKNLEWEQFGKTLLDNHLERANEILATCDDESFMKYYMPFLEYFKPKLARSENINSNDNRMMISINWEDATPIHTITATTLESVKGIIGSE